MVKDPILSIHQLTKAFGRLKVLRGIDLEFSKPGVSAILGPNGSGKTTLLKCLLGMVIPDSGSIHMQGEDIRGRWEYRDRIDYLPQIARFPENLRVGELLAMMGQLRTHKPLESQLIELFGLDPFMDKKLGHLSGGTRQKVNITLALMHDSPLILLDEPTAGLDPVARLRLKDLIQKQAHSGKTILITTHVMSLVEEVAEEVVFLMDGSVHFRGSIQSLKGLYGKTSLERAIAAILTGEATFSSNGKTQVTETPVKV